MRIRLQRGTSVTPSERGIASLGLIAAVLLAGCGGSKHSVAPQPAAPTTTVPNGPASQPAKAPAPSAGGAANYALACSYITRIEMADLLGAPIGPPIDEHTAGTSSCAYPPG